MMDVAGTWKVGKREETAAAGIDKGSTSYPRVVSSFGIVVKTSGTSPSCLGEDWISRRRLWWDPQMQTCMRKLEDCAA